MKSMTGYGKGVAARDGRELTVELKSVNHRFLDIGMRVPRILSCTEDTIRRVIGDSAPIIILTAYDWADIEEEAKEAGVLIMLAEEATGAAIDVLEVMRTAEGERLKTALLSGVDSMAAYRETILQRAPSVVEDYRRKLTERIEQALSDADIDRARLATEVALFADRACIDEELVRLESHIAQFRAYLEAAEPIGRKMDFLIQEMNRECNTIGSKANDAELTNTVLLCKAEIEKLREQIQNVE